MMPTKFKAVIGLYLFSVATSLWEVLTVEKNAWVPWIGLILNVLILLGLLRGNESIRKLVMLFATIGLIVSGVSLAFALLVSLVKLTAILTAIAAAFGVLRSGFVLWTLSRQDVQFYMFKKSTRTMGM